MDYELYAPSYRLPCLSKRITYGVGHIINDLTSTVYYNFVLLYLINVAGLEFAHAGYVVLVGQAVSAVGSVAVDRLGQQRNALCCCYSKRKSWHIVGTLLVIVGFLFLFMPCVGFSTQKSVYKALYYGGFVLLFQVGWSFVQSSHLHLIPEITRNQHERIELNAIRYTISIVGQIIVFSVTWLLFALSKSSTINADDQTWFRTLAITVTATGFVTAALFHIGTDETGYDLFLETHLSSTSYNRMTNTRWSKEPQFYQILFLHLFTRVSASVAIMYLPLYISQTLSMHKAYLAAYPFAALLGAIFVPFAVRPLARSTSPKVTYSVGAVLVMAVVVWAWFLKSTWNLYQLQAFALVTVLGAGGAITTFSSLTMAQTVIGDNIETGAFVFSAMSIVDKLMTGVAVLIIQQLNTCGLGSVCEQTYYRYVFTGVVGGAAAAGFLIWLTLLKTRLGRLRYTADVLVSSVSKSEGEASCEAHMDHFERTPEADCFNHWSCLSSSREAEAHSVALIYSTPERLKPHLPSVSSSSSVNGPYVIPAAGRRCSHDADGLPQYDPGWTASSSAPSLIEYSGNHERHHRKRNSPKRAPTTAVDRQHLLENEQVPEPTAALPAAVAGAGAADTAAGPSGAEAAAPQTRDPSGTSTQVDVHPVPDSIYAGGRSPGGSAQGSPYDNVQVSVTPGGKIIDPESKE